VKKQLALAILSISMITVMASAAVSPALANISNAFPNAGMGLIKTILTLPSLLIIPFSLLSGILVHKFGNKKVLISGIIIYIIGGIAPVWANTIPQLLIFRAILGCGCGLIMPISQILIASNFRGSIKARITGYSGAASYLMGVVASFVVAPLSSINWHYSFYIYLIAVLVLILNIIILPNTKPVQTEKTDKSAKISRNVWTIILGILLVNIAFYAVPANVALFMKEQQIGSHTSAGIVISLFMIAGFLAGIFLHHLKGIFKSYIVLFGITVMALGYIILSISYDMFSVITGAALVGFSFGILFPSLLILITGKCSDKACVAALSIASCSQFLGQFLSPYVLSIIKYLFGLESLRYDFVILAVGLSTFVIVYFSYRQLTDSTAFLNPARIRVNSRKRR